MAINDKILTLITGAVLAVGGGAASLFLGDHEEASRFEPDLAIVATLELPDVPTQAVPTATIVVADIAPFEAPVLPQTATITTDEDPAFVFASVEPKTHTASADVGSDLVEVAVIAGLPELALPAEIHDIVLTRAISPLPSADMPRYSAGIPSQQIDLARALVMPQTSPVSCALDVRATPIFGARVSLNLTAPCHPNMVVTIRHGGLQFKERLDNSGELKVKIPAFSEFARFEIELSDGTRKTVGAYIAGMSSIERVGISWSGGNDTFLHAFQKGAKAGDKNHVWRFNPNDVSNARVLGGGYMTLLGNVELQKSRLVQIYTLPKTKVNAGQFVSLGIETLRGESACGEDMLLKVARHSAISGGSQSALSVKLPECGAVNSSLVLKNVLKDMKVARK